MFRQVLNFIYVWNRRSGTKGIVNFSLDPIVYKLQKANRESFEFCWMLKLPKRREKSLRFAVCKKTPAQFSKFEKKHLSLFFKIRIHVLLQVTKSQSRRKIWEKHKMQENLCPIFQIWLKTLAEFFPVEKVKKGHWGWKKICPLLKKNV